MVFERFCKYSPLPVVAVFMTTTRLKLQSEGSCAQLIGQRGSLKTRGRCCDAAKKRPMFLSGIGVNTSSLVKNLLQDRIWHLSRKLVASSKSFVELFLLAVLTMSCLQRLTMFPLRLQSIVRFQKSFQNSPACRRYGALRQGTVILPQLAFCLRAALVIPCVCL